jgi:hypothetical protein
MASPGRELAIGVGVAAIVSIVVQAFEPILSILSMLLVVPTILLALGLAWTIPKLRWCLAGRTVPAALIAGLVINFLPYPAGSLGARVSFYAQLALHKKEIDAQCIPAIRCNDPSRTTTLITEGFGSIIQGIARDDSGTLLNVSRRHGRAPNPLQGCENGLVHLYGPYFHWGCG